MMEGYDPFGANPLGSSGDTFAPPALESFGWRQTIISQYANSPVILSLIDSASQYIDPAYNMAQFFNLVWNVDTAQGYGLDVWGRIVGVNRILKIPSNQEYFGFEQDTQAEPFNVEPFYAGEIITQNFALSDDAFRLLILAKAMANITDGSVAAANAILMTLFPNHGNCYMRDNLNMTITWVFGAPLSPVENSIVLQSGVLPKPAGVGATVEIS